jgi:hypothetical protein
MAFRDTLLRVTRILQPNGRAYRIPYGGPFEKFYKAIMSDDIGGMGRLYGDMKQIMSDILPDNPDFDIEDAHDWYRRLGLYDSGSVSLADMKAAITQKMSWTVTPLARQSATYMQEQLRLAGFDVYVYPNRFDDGMGGWVTKTPGEILGMPAGLAVYGGMGYGDTGYGGGWIDAGITLVMNYLEWQKDATFVITAEGYKSTFYIAGATVDAFANVSTEREIEFRQLILKLKSAPMCGILFVNYT